jgi:hypothetical protein
MARTSFTSVATHQIHAGADNDAMVKVIARAFGWHRLLSDGVYATLDDLAKGEKINPSYVSRITRLAFLSPKIVEAILDGRHPAHVTMKDLMQPFPLDWERQQEHFDGR